MTEKRKKALRRRRVFIAGVCVVVAAAIIGVAIGVFAIVNALRDGKSNNTQSSTSSPVSSGSAADSSAESQQNSSVGNESREDMVVRGEYTLDANYSRLLLVNAENPLPQDYDYGANLVTIEAKYHNGQLDQINKDIWPFMKAMIEAAWADNVKLYVWSPYRSYDIQNMLFQKQVTRMNNQGYSGAEAEEKAATVVARPGTSEHNTGLCSDFNMASDKFESTEMFTWMKQHAADYGFILRYPSDKQNVTGVIYESWHWRFVGINAAKEMNERGMTLEEYVKYKKIAPQSELEKSNK